MARNVWETESISTKGKKDQAKPTHQYSQLHDKVAVRFALKEIFQGDDVGMFDPAERKNEADQICTFEILNQPHCKNPLPTVTATP